MRRHQVGCWLVNTGWSGGPYGVGERMPLPHTRAILEAALNGELDGVPYLQLCENRPYDCLDAAEVDRLVLEIGGTGDEMERRMSAGGDLL